VLSVLDLESEPGQPPAHRAVELGAVLQSGGFAQPRAEMVAKVGEDLGAGLDEVLVVAVALLRLVAGGTVVGALRLLAILDQSSVVAREKVELRRDDVGEAPSPDHEP
jgi:hypothetical protein